MWGGDKGPLSFFEGIFTQHCSSSVSKDAPPAFLLPTEFRAPSLWLSMSEELSLDIIPDLGSLKLASESPMYLPLHRQHLPPLALTLTSEHKPCSGGPCILSRTVIAWLQDCPKGWCLSTCCSAALTPASSLLWPVPGVYLQSAAYSQWLLPNQNKSTQLQLEGLHTICILVSFPQWEAFPMGTKITTHFCDIKQMSCMAVFPACSCWNAAVCHLKVFFNIKSRNQFG